MLQIKQSVVLTDFIDRHVTFPYIERLRLDLVRHIWIKLRIEKWIKVKKEKWIKVKS